jgi:hypothetical protein
MKLTKKLLSIATIIALTVTLLQVNPLTAKAAEGSMEDAQVIQVGEKIKSDTLMKDSEDWYKFTTSKNLNSWYRVGYISKDSILNVYVYDEDGKELIHMNSSVGNEKLEHLKLEPEKDYYMKAEIGMGVVAESTTYTLYTQELIDKAPDSEEGAIELFNGVKFVGSLECVRDDDWYTFTAGASKTTIDLSAKFDKGLILKAYNEDGAELKNMKVVDKKSDSLQLDTVKGEKYFIYVCSGRYTENSDKASGQYTISLKSGLIKISDLTIEDIMKKSYTGKALTPDISIYNGKTKLIKGRDYTLSYKNNTKIGKATVTIKGKGNYTGTAEKTFKIVNR